jgi:uncharacterized protein involved in tolerance to divalent cations
MEDILLKNHALSSKEEMQMMLKLKSDEQHKDRRKYVSKHTYSL